MDKPGRGSRKKEATSDPYVIFTLMDEEGKEVNKLKSETKQKTGRKEWYREEDVPADGTRTCRNLLLTPPPPLPRSLPDLERDVHHPSLGGNDVEG